VDQKPSEKKYDIHILSQGWSEKLSKRYARFGRNFDLVPPWHLCHVQNPAIAFWRYQHEQQRAPVYTKSFYCADFTHIRLSMTGGRAEPVQLPAQDAEHLRQDLEKAFAMLNWQKSPDANFGYLADPPCIVPQLTPLPWLYGREIRQEWQSGFRDFYRLQAEIELFLATHPVNRQRQQAALPAVNAVWFWGKSDFPFIKQNFTAVIIGKSENIAWQAFADYLSNFAQNQPQSSQQRFFLWQGTAEISAFQDYLRPGQKIAIYDYQAEKSYFWTQQWWSNFL
jgi:hypothetical protein